MNPRVRFRYSKAGKVRFCSHRDLARVWERALRRVRLPVAYSEGFSPRPKLSFGLALSTGYESLAEYVDVELTTLTEPDALPATLTAAMPAGIVVDVARPLEPGTPSLQQSVVACRWEIDVAAQSADDVAGWIDRVLAAPSIIATRERKGKPVTDDLRPQVLSLQLLEHVDDDVRICTDLATQPRALRPSELLAAVEPPLRERLVRRTHQWIELDGQWHEPLPGATAVAPRTEVCAS